MTDDRRAIEMEVAVPGTREQVWRAVATGPGISSWYVPHTVEERTGGVMTASFGPAPEMQVEGRVALWDPPDRFVCDGGEGVEGLVFDWRVEGDDGSCVVRLTNSGFGSGEEWDGQFEAMEEGWRIFLANLGLHLRHFPGRVATPLLPLAGWPGPRDAAWTRLTDALGLPERPDVGTRVAATGTGVPPLAGTVLEAGPHRMALLLDEPAPGTAFVAAEGRGADVEVSLWMYLYGDEAALIAERDDPLWRSWLAEQA